MIAVAFALEFESACFRARHDPRLCVGIWLLGEMGRGAARNLEKRLSEARPKLLISAGFAGGLQPGLKAGDLILGENHSDPEVVARLSLSEGWRVGCVATAEEILQTAEEKRFLGMRTGCLAGDLETMPLAQICAERGVRMLSVRCISDVLEDDLPVPADILLNPRTGRPDPWGLFRHLIGHPSSVPGFNKLLRDSKVAQNQLARGLEELVPQLVRIA